MKTDSHADVRSRLVGLHASFDSSSALYDLEYLAVIIAKGKRRWILQQLLLALSDEATVELRRKPSRLDLTSSRVGGRDQNV